MNDERHAIAEISPTVRKSILKTSGYVIVQIARRFLGQHFAPVYAQPRKRFI